MSETIALRVTPSEHSFVASEAKKFGCMTKENKRHRLPALEMSKPLGSHCQSLHHEATPSHSRLSGSRERQLRDLDLGSEKASNQ